MKKLLLPLAGVAAAVLSLAGAFASAAAAPAVRDSFVRCDGYPAPTGGTDGMFASFLRDSAQSTYWSAPTGNLSRQASDAGAAGVEACGSAIESLRPVRPTPTLRMASLLRARALRRIEVGDPAAALADLDAAEAAMKADPALGPHRRVDVALRLTRALALARLGRAEEACALAMAASEARPYDLQVQSAALAVLQLAGPGADIKTLRLREARLDPLFFTDLFYRDLAAGRFEDALGFCGELTARPRPRAYPLSKSDSEIAEAEFWSDNLLLLADSSGACAYMLAATGRPDEARKSLDKVRQAVKDAAAPVKPFPPLNIDGKPDPANAVVPGLHARTLAQATPIAESWIKATEALIAAGGDRAQAPLPDLASRLSTDDVPLAEAAARLAILDISESPSWATMAGRVMFIDKKSPPGSQKLMIRITGETDAAAFELALLTAAAQAEKAGYAGMVVTARFGVREIDIRTRSPIGVTVYLFVELFDPKAPPADAHAFAWRVIDAPAAKAKLMPIYGKIPK